MALLFTCPHCGTEMTVRQKDLGREGPCVHCGHTVTIPADAAGCGSINRFSKWRRIVLYAFGALIVGGGLLTLILYSVVSSMEHTNEKKGCLRNLRKIATGIQNYELQYGQLPPAYIADKDGRPMHSWRVLVHDVNRKHFPDMAGYKYDVPWDDSANHHVSRFSPNEYRCPSNRGRSHGRTDYMMIVGPGCITDGPNSQKLSSIPSPAHTLMIAEVANSDVPWTKPRDLDALRIQYRINEPINPCISSHHPGGACVMFADGHVKFLDERISPQILRKMTRVQEAPNIQNLHYQAD